MELEALRRRFPRVDWVVDGDGYVGNRGGAGGLDFLVEPKRGGWHVTAVEGEFGPVMRGAAGTPVQAVAVLAYLSEFADALSPEPEPVTHITIPAPAMPGRYPHVEQGNVIRPREAVFLGSDVALQPGNILAILGLGLMLLLCGGLGATWITSPGDRAGVERE